jgi:3-oxoacyl-ACP reductase-like protein
MINSLKRAIGVIIVDLIHMLKISLCDSMYWLSHVVFVDETKVLQTFFGGKTVLVTGASSGIGRSLAMLLYQLGANIVLSSRDESGLEKCAKECFRNSSSASSGGGGGGGGGGKILIVPIDLEKYQDFASYNAKLNNALKAEVHL